jgi:hypothetical protein
MNLIQKLRSLFQKVSSATEHIETAEDLVPHYMPSLLYMLQNSENTKGASLTKQEVLEIRNKAVFMKIAKSDKNKLDEQAGYKDIDPENCWEEWCAYKNKDIERAHRKEKSEFILKERNIKINQWLPCVEAAEEITIRTPEEIAKRIVILMALRSVSYEERKPDEVIEHLKQCHLWGDVTESEKQFLADPTEEKRCTFSWEIEKIYVLMWAVNRINEISFPNDVCDSDQMKFADPFEFINSITSTRSKAEILDMSDLYYRLDWACVDANLSQTQVEGLNHRVVYCRHFALNWLANYCNQDWDNVTCDT